MQFLTRAELWERYQGNAITRAVTEMEANGFAIDAAFCEKQAAVAQGDETETLLRLKHWLSDRGVPPLPGADDIWSSPKQLNALLHDHLRYPPSPIWKKGRVKLHKGERKTDEAALGWIRNRVPSAERWGIDEIIRLRRIRGCIKYLTKLPTFIAPDGLVHPVCGPAGDDDDRVGTITGRLAGKNPEFQQVPLNKDKDPYRIRRAFIAPPDHSLIVADYSALEAVVMGHIAVVLFGDHQLAEMLAPGAPDFHSVNAKKVFHLLGWKVSGIPVGDYSTEAFQQVEGCKRLRQMVKEIWYGGAYGKSVFGFATSLKDEYGEAIGEEKAQAIVDAFLETIPAVRRYQRWVWDFIKKYKGISGLGGRWCDLKELVEGDEWQQKRAHRIAQNFPNQEAGAWIVGAAMVSVMRDAELNAAGLKLERQVHDELNYRIPSKNEQSEELMQWAKQRIADHMTSCVTLEVPLQVSIGHGQTWADAK